MPSYRVVAIPTEVANAVRSTLKSPGYGHPTHTEVATGLRAQEYVTDSHVDAVIDRLLAQSDVDYIHVRDTRAGCFDFSIERG
jgi:hypothetical protein